MAFTTEDQSGGQSGASAGEGKSAAVAAASAVAAKHAEKRGRGRPPGSSKGNRPAVETNSEPGETVAPVVDREFIERTTAVGLRVLDRIVTRKVVGAVESMASNLTVKAHEFAGTVAMLEDEIKMVSGTMGVIAEKYSKLFAFAPEIALLGWGAGYAMRVGSTLSEIRQLAEEIKKYHQHADSPQADQNPHPRA